MIEPIIHSKRDAPTEPTELNIEEGIEYIPTPTVLPRMMLIAEKVPSFPPFEIGLRKCGVSGKASC